MKHEDSRTRKIDPELLGSRKSEPFQIEVKLDLLDQKMMQNRNMKILEHEKIVQNS